MLTLSRSLFDELGFFHRAVDDLFERSWRPAARPLPSPYQASTFRPEQESYVKDGHFTHRLSIPGVDPKDIHVSLNGNQMTVKGERKAPSGIDSQNWHLREFRYGPFEWTFGLPEGLDCEKLTATCTNGVLEISLAIAKSHLPRKIEVREVGSEDRKGLKATA